MILWQEKNKNGYIWYLGYLKQKTDVGFSVDHLHRVVAGSNKLWSYPSNEDIQDIETDQILDIDAKGEWDLRDSRNTKFILLNEK